MEIVDGNKLDDGALTRLSEIYLQMWRPILDTELWECSTEEDMLGKCRKQFASRIEIFPEGQLAVLDPAEGVMGGLSTIMVSAMDEDGQPDYGKVEGKWEYLTSFGYIDGYAHDPDGNLVICYAINIPPEHHGKGVARALLHGGTKFAKDKGLIACPYTRPSGLDKYLKKIGFDPMQRDELLDGIVGEYVSMRDEHGRLLDENIGVHSHFGAEVVRIMPYSRPCDLDSWGYCVLMAYPKGYVVPLNK
ncbi:MAG: hypothetical protein JSV63_01055 [Candidatus Aenigmatarchaeota archaeon]|nr:MAG: hypothetical protein JSV63_01055 [Candidatus Aenigmarchaeota archaeon]